VNLLFLVEGEKTEPKVYKAWLKHLFPSLNFVIRPEDMTKNTCRIIPGNGYPNMVSTPKLYPQVSRLEACLIDIERFGNVDHFFICVDSEDESYTDRFNEIQHKVNDFKSRRNINEAKIKIHIIIQYCCIETWALGNAEIPHQYPSSNSSRILPQFRAYYDVTVYDPEGMYGYPEGFSFSKKAKFHQSYLKEYLRFPLKMMNREMTQHNFCYWNMTEPLGIKILSKPLGSSNTPIYMCAQISIIFLS